MKKQLITTIIHNSVYEIMIQYPEYIDSYALVSTKEKAINQIARYRKNSPEYKFSLRFRQTVEKIYAIKEDETSSNTN